MHDDLVKKVFTAPGPNLVWLTDITEHATSEGKLQLCAIKDVYSNQFVGYSIDSRMKASLAVAALRSAIALRAPAAGLIVHSDRGSQFRSKKFVRVLKAHQLRGSMAESAPAATTPPLNPSPCCKERRGPQRWPNRHQPRLAIVSWIETSYHRRRRQRGLGKLTIEFETIQPVALAA